jgi:prevent-host-death family protein
MSEIGARDLRNRTREVLERVDGGEPVTITIDGQPVAELRHVADRRTWLPRKRFIGSVLRQADADLAVVLRELAPDVTDDLPS